MTRIRSALRRDEGATLVEFAFVGPILFFLLIAMLDIGLVVLGKSVASGAARDGARVGIIHFDDADNPASANYALVKAAVEAKLVGHIRPAPGQFVEVRCLDGDTKAPEPCDRNTIQVDFDLIEVTVEWDSISAGAGLVVPTGHSDKARMVIIGDGTAGTVTPPCVGTGVIEFSTATPPPVGELDTDTTVTLTVNRTGDIDCTSSVTYTTAALTATGDVDYESQSNLVVFAPGAPDATISIVIKGDNAGESSETFTVTLSAPVGKTLGAPTTSTVTITDDDSAAPQLLSLEFFDAGPSGIPNGRVDRVVATFDQALTDSCPTPGAFVFTNTPSGGARGAVTFSGTTVTVAVTEGAGARDTAVGTFQVQLDAGCVTASGSGMAATFPATTPVDKAKPVLLDVVDTNGTTDGMAQLGDTLTFTFSEAMATAAPSTVVTEGPGTAGQLSINGIISTTNLNPQNIYAVTTDVTFDSEVVTSGSQVTVTLEVCTFGCANVGQGRSSPGITFAVSPSLQDLAPTPNTATGSITTADNYSLF